MKDEVAVVTGEATVVRVAATAVTTERVETAEVATVLLPGAKVGAKVDVMAVEITAATEARKAVAQTATRMEERVEAGWGMAT